MMKGQIKVDEFVFVLLAGLVLILIFMFAWTVPPEEKANVTATKPGEVPLQLIYEPREMEVKYALGLEMLDSKENVEVASSLLTSKEINLVGEISEGKLAEATDAFVVLIIDSTNMLKPLVVTVNEKEIYRDVPQPGSLYLSIKKELLRTKNIVTIKTEFPGWLQFWKTSRYELKEAKFGINVYGPAFKDFEFNLEKEVLQNFKYAKLEFDVSNRVGNANLVIKINDYLIWRDVAKIGKFEKVIDYKRFFKEGKNVLSFSAEPTVTYKLKDISFTLVYERR
jgi:hypothetical protein